jgi:hypothetical protein
MGTTIGRISSSHTISTLMLSLISKSKTQLVNCYYLRPARSLLSLSFKLMSKKILILRTVKDITIISLLKKTRICLPHLGAVKMKRMHW